MGYQDIVAELHGRESKKVGNNSYLHKVDGDKVAYKLHETDIVIFSPKEIELNSGGWQTPTTKDRINRALSMAKVAENIPNRWDAYLQQSHGNWYLGKTPFMDGMKLNYDGKILTKVKEAEKELGKREELEKEISRYVRALSKRIDEGTLNLESGGDCWMCSMRTQEGNTLGEATNDDHLMQHLKQKYFMVTLINNALEKRGYRFPAIFFANSEGKPDLEVMRQHKDTILRAVRRYFKDELLDRTRQKVRT